MKWDVIKGKKWIMETEIHERQHLRAKVTKMLKLIQFHQIIQTIYQLFDQKVVLVKKQQFVQ